MGENTARNRENRRQKDERAKTEAVQFLLDGLEVSSISELKRLVDAGRVLDTMIAVAGEGARLEFDATPLLERPAERIFCVACGGSREPHEPPCACLVEASS